MSGRKQKKGPPSVRSKEAKTFTFDVSGSGPIKASRSKSDLVARKKDIHIDRRSKTQAGIGGSYIDEEFTGLRVLRKKDKNKGKAHKSGSTQNLNKSFGDFSEKDRSITGLDAESVISQYSVTTTPKSATKYRNIATSPISRMKRMNTDQRSWSSGGNRPRAFSNALKQSIADLSEAVLTRKNSLTIAEEENERVANEDAVTFISEDLISSTLNAPMEELSERYHFGGYNYDDYNCFNKDQEYFINFYKDAFEELELSKLYNDDEVLLERFLRMVSKNYRDEKTVPFHCFKHGFSVGQVAVTFVLRNYFLKRFFDKKTLFTFIIACIVHDVDHPGNDNYFEMVTKSVRNKKHGNVATLEHHHSEKLLEMMKNDAEKNIFKYLDYGKQSLVIELACDLIIATDMGKHKEQLNSLKGIEQLKDIMGEDNIDTQMDLLGCLIHACDLSGQCFNREIAERWEDNIHREMEGQFKKTVKDQLSLPNHMQHFHKTGNSGEAARYKSQASFINFVLVPYWTEVVRLIPEMSDFLENLKKNGQFFQGKAEGLADL